MKTSVKKAYLKPRVRNAKSFRKFYGTTSDMPPQYIAYAITGSTADYWGADLCIDGKTVISMWNDDLEQTKKQDNELVKIEDIICEFFAEAFASLHARQEYLKWKALGVIFKEDATKRDFNNDSV